MTLDYYMELVELAESGWDVWEIVAMADEDDALSDNDANRLEAYAEGIVKFLEDLND